MLDLVLLSSLLGAIAGFLAGLFGLGGGVVIVPALMWLFSIHQFPTEQLMIMAVATSLATIIPTSISSIISHHRLGTILWSSVTRLIPTIILGAAVGALFAGMIPMELLQWLFIGYLCFATWRMIQPVNIKPVTIRQNNTLDYWAGSVTGFLSALLGIGGGTLTVPYLISRGIEMKNAVAISSVCGLPIALSGTVIYAFSGHEKQLPEWSLGYIYLPALLGIMSCSILTAPIGAKLANKLPSNQLKHYFSIVIILIIVKMVFS